MRVLVSVSIVLLCAVPAWATVITIQDQTTAGNDPAVRDNYMRQDGSADSNGGTTGGTIAVNDVRMYPDTGYETKGPRHLMIGFDLSSLKPGWTINSATYRIFFKRLNSSTQAINDYKLSRMLPGKDWIEGLSNMVTPTSLGEPTWNSQKHQSNPAWQVPGATGDNDCDKLTTQTWSKTAGASEWITFDVKSWVEDWVKNGYENNGMLHWGGVDPTNNSGNYWKIYTSEYESTVDRPYLTIDYTVPEPASILLLFAGLGGLCRRRVV